MICTEHVNAISQHLVRYLFQYQTEIENQKLIDASYQLTNHNALNKYLTMYHFVIEMCTQVDISVTKWCFVGYGTGALLDMGLVHCGICATGL